MPEHSVKDIRQSIFMAFAQSLEQVTPETVRAGKARLLPRFAYASCARPTLTLSSVRAISL
jgi:hypothetical protein